MENKTLTSSEDALKIARAWNAQFPTQILTEGLECPPFFISPKKKKGQQRSKQQQAAKERHLKLKIISQQATTKTLLKHIFKNHEELHQLRDEVAKLREFKELTHRLLDELGVPTHPDGPHADAGCRVGQRFHWMRHAIATINGSLGVVNQFLDKNYPEASA